MLPAPAAPIEALPPGAVPPAPGLVPAQPTPVPEQRPGMLQKNQRPAVEYRRERRGADSNRRLPRRWARRYRRRRQPQRPRRGATGAWGPVCRHRKRRPCCRLSDVAGHWSRGSAPVLRVAIVAAVLIAVIAVEISSRSGVTWRLITFTYQANVLAAAYYLWTLVSPRADARVGLRGAVVLYVVIAGVVWNLSADGPQHGLHARERPASRRRAGPGAQRLASRRTWVGPSALVASAGLAGVPRVVCRAGRGACSTRPVAERRTTFSTPAVSGRPRWCSIFVCWAAACSPSATRCWR